METNRPTAVRRPAAALALLILAASAFPSAALAAPDQSKAPRLAVYGHAYLRDQNTPLANVVVEVSRGGKAVASAKTDRSGLYQMDIENRAGFLDLCVRPTSFSKVASGGYCETVSAFQKAPRVVGGVEVRELEHDFFMDEKGANLNLLYENEITNKPQDEACTEYQKTVQAARDKSEEEAAVAEAAKAMEDLKAKYRMPPNTAMTGPLKSIQVIGSVAEASGSAKLDPLTVTVTAFAADGTPVGSAVPGTYGDFSLDLLPPGSDPFLNPVSLRVSSFVTMAADGRQVPAYRTAWFRAASEKVIVNARLEDNVQGPLDVPVRRRSGFPFVGLTLCLAAVAAFAGAVISFRLKVRRHDM